MYVARLEVPWSATEFPLQGVLINSREDIANLARYGQTVYIDQNKSISSTPKKPVQQVVAQIFACANDTNKKRSPRVWRKYCTHQYAVKSPIGKEISQAQKLLARVDSALAELKPTMQNLNPSAIEGIRVTSNAIVTSVLDNPDALLWLMKVKENKGRVYDHTIRSTIWAITLGRAMGIQKSSLFALSQAVLLSGVGKSYLKKNDWLGYQGAEMTFAFARWSSMALHKLSQCNLEPRVMTIIAGMTERYDGSGLPHKKAGKDIPYLSQIASLAESFDLILYPMPGNKKRLFSQALARLYCLSDRLFDRVLVEEFIQATGLYPAGTQVILSDGSKGVVVEQSKARRLRATVALTHDSDGYRLLSYQVVALGEGKFKNTLIEREAPISQINQDDQTRINQLIKKHQRHLVSRVVDGFSGMFSR